MNRSKSKKELKYICYFSFRRSIVDQENRANLWQRLEEMNRKNQRI